MTGGVIELESPAVGVVKAGTNIVVGSMDKSFHSYHIKVRVLARGPRPLHLLASLVYRLRLLSMLCAIACATMDCMAVSSGLAAAHNLRPCAEFVVVMYCCCHWCW